MRGGIFNLAPYPTESYVSDSPPHVLTKMAKAQWYRFFSWENHQCVLLFRLANAQIDFLLSIAIVYATTTLII
jgi:hypothetical protein